MTLRDEVTFYNDVLQNLLPTTNSKEPDNKQSVIPGNDRESHIKERFHNQEFTLSREWQSKMTLRFYNDVLQNLLPTTSPKAPNNKQNVIPGNDRESYY